MPDLSTWNVLVVDDEPDNIGLIELVLNFYKANVRTAASGRACLTLLREEMPSVVLMDIQMPEMSGFDVLKAIRENTNWKHLPVIAITAHAMVGDEERIMAAGFDGYVAKPVNAMTLADQLMEIMSTKVKR